MTDYKLPEPAGKIAYQTRPYEPEWISSADAYEAAQMQQAYQAGHAHDDTALLRQALEYAKMMKLYGPAMGYGNTTLDEHITALRERLGEVK